MNVVDEMRIQKDILKECNCDEIKYYGLINNDGYTFIKNGVKHDLRHWLNCYGCDVDYWTLSCKDGYRSFKTFNDAVEFIKTM